MKVVFIIGNGFDINLGLATQYENSIDFIWDWIPLMIVFK